MQQQPAPQQPVNIVARLRTRVILSAVALLVFGDLALAALIQGHTPTPLDYAGSTTLGLGLLGGIVQLFGLLFTLLKIAAAVVSLIVLVISVKRLDVARREQEQARVDEDRVYDEMFDSAYPAPEHPAQTWPGYVSLDADR